MPLVTADARLRRDKASAMPVDEVTNAWGDVPEERARALYALRCRLCGYNVVVRGERLSPICDVLAEHGVTDISLVALSARLSRSMDR